MGRIFKNLVPYWKSVIMILVLLVLQAFCDLSLPQYTSDIIDVGIQNKGVGHVMPAAKYLQRKNLKLYQNLQ
jgi:ATP-binding cassette, subfamily B, multidrug efflux pump